MTTTIPGLKAGTSTCSTSLREGPRAGVRHEHRRMRGHDHLAAPMLLHAPQEPQEQDLPRR
jgi:hypothetical protein